MSKREDYEQKTEALVMPLIEENGFELVDVEYVKEAGNYYLRVYIDKEGGITVDDCEVISRALGDKLDADGSEFTGTWKTFEEGEGFFAQHRKRDRDKIIQSNQPSERF